jgi:tRNA threonylcarbamoyladenosine biosynthesis protein TsaB
MEMKDLKILAIDTSGKVSSVSIIEDEKILAEFNINNSLTHSQTIMPMVENALDCAKISIKEIDGFAASIGPGSFTGLRIGIGAIKGMAFALNKPCVGVSTLESLAYNLKGMDGIICAVMDARCSQVYTACFENEQRLTDDEAVYIEQLGLNLKKYNKKVFLVGDGANLCYNILKEHNIDVHVASAKNLQSSATSVAMIAQKDFLEEKTCSAKELFPFYLRLPQAEQQRLKKEMCK